MSCQFYCHSRAGGNPFIHLYKTPSFLFNLLGKLLMDSRLRGNDNKTDMTDYIDLLSPQKIFPIFRSKFLCIKLHRTLKK